MMQLDQNPLRHVVSRLCADAKLDAAEIAMINALADHRISVPQNRPVDARLMSRPLFLVSGWAAQQRLLSQGRRQIVRLFVPGDFIPAGLRDLKALTNVVFISATPLLMAAADGAAPALLKAYRVAREAMIGTQRRFAACDQHAGASWIEAATFPGRYLQPQRRDSAPAQSAGLAG